MGMTKEKSLQHYIQIKGMVSSRLGFCFSHDNCLEKER